MKKLKIAGLLILAMASTNALAVTITDDLKARYDAGTAPSPSALAIQTFQCKTYEVADQSETDAADLTFSSFDGYLIDHEDKSGFDGLTFVPSASSLDATVKDSRPLDNMRNYITVTYTLSFRLDSKNNLIGKTSSDYDGTYEYDLCVPKQ